MAKRHEDWERVEPGHVIPAGQPYKIVWPEGDYWTYPAEMRVKPRTVSDGGSWFVDTTWRPPLVLPTEPTWGIAVGAFGSVVMQKWYKNQHTFEGEQHRWDVIDVLDFIPLTEEQVQRIEAVK